MGEMTVRDRIKFVAVLLLIAMTCVGFFAAVVGGIAMASADAAIWGFAFLVVGLVGLIIATGGDF